jgi:bacterioferritin-associated ferredoxin
MGMIVCLCKGFNEEAVRQHLLTLDGKEAKLGDVYRACAKGKRPGCGKCVFGKLQEMVDEYNNQQSNPQPV